jgi:hypothetical protein
MKYVIAESSSPEELEKQVNSYLAQGWSLQGGVSITNIGDGRNFRFAQALVDVSKTARPKQ